MAKLYVSCFKSWDMPDYFCDITEKSAFCFSALEKANPITKVIKNNLNIIQILHVVEIFAIFHIKLYAHHKFF